MESSDIRSTAPVIDPFVWPSPVSSWGYETPGRVGLLSADSGKPSATIEGEGGPIIVPDFSHDWQYIGLLRPPSARLTDALTALQNYRRRFQALRIDKGTEFPFAFRYCTSPITGLPAYLRGWLQQPVGKDNMITQSEGWFDTDDIALSLLADKDWRQRFTPPDGQRYPEIVTTTSSLGVEQSQRLLRHHLRYLQWYSKWPVVGGGLAVHLTEGDCRVSVTSSYLPIPDHFEAPDISEEDQDRAEKAKHAARAAMNHYSIGARYQAARDAWNAYLHREAILETPGVVKDSDLANSDPLLDWKVELHQQTLARRLLALVPYLGKIYLAYEVHLTSPDGVETWSVFVDADKLVVLGRPRNLTCHSLQHMVYTGSKQKHDDQAPSQLVNLAPPPGTNPCAEFMDIYVYDEAATDHRRPANWNTNSTSGPDFEAINVAFHAHLAFEFLKQLIGAEPFAAAILQRGRLTARVSMPDLNCLNMGFNPSTKEITFQRDVEPFGLAAEGSKVVYQPSLDAEVIYHEVIHALMWLLNPDPFEHCLGVAPFARALVEGYANYLARALGVVHTGNGQPEWALAAYRKEPGQWGDRWALSRSAQFAGADLFAVPNLFPTAFAEGLPVYDVGMIWARTLWDVRAPVGEDAANALSMEAWQAALGWVTSFEGFAELYLEAAALASGLDLGDSLLPLFADRGILAGQGIQALRATGTTIMVGSNAGLMRSMDSGSTWQPATDEKLSPTTQLTGVVAVAIDGTAAVYAATGSDVFKRIAGQTEWKPVGGWTPLPDLPAPQPLSLAYRGGMLYAGTSIGVWCADVRSIAAPGAIITWTPYNPSDEDLQPYTGLVLDLAVSRAGVVGPLLYVAGLNAVWVRPLDDTKPWRLRGLSDEAKDLVICVASSDTQAFAGTATAGIWAGTPSADGTTFTRSQLVAASALGNAAVLCLVVVGPTVLYAGTTQGVFRVVQQNGGWASQAVAGLPVDAMVTSMAVLNDHLYAGTARHGLYQYSPLPPDAAALTGAWTPVAEVRPLAGSDIAQVNSLTPQQFTVAASTTARLHVHPFELMESKRIRAQNSASLDMTLWRLGVHPQDLASGTSPLTTSVAQAAGFYAISMETASAYQLTITAIV